MKRLTIRQEAREASAEVESGLKARARALLALLTLAVGAGMGWWVWTEWADGVPLRRGEVGVLVFFGAAALLLMVGGIADLRRVMRSQGDKPGP